MRHMQQHLTQINGVSSRFVQSKIEEQNTFFFAVRLKRKNACEELRVSACQLRLSSLDLESVRVL